MSRVRGALPLVVAWTVFAAYLLAARGVGNFFPLSVFDMYQAHAPEAVARFVVLDAGGERAEIEDFVAFHCEPEPPALAAAARACGPEHVPLAYVTRDQQIHLDRHRSGDADGEAVTIVSRAWLLEPRPGAPSSSDCVIARCTARRREASP